MKGLAIYCLVALLFFSIYSLFYAVKGDNSPFWIIVLIACLPILVFTLIYLIRKR
jgi:hypothetical protein